MAKTAVQAPRFDAFWVAPETLKLITDKASPYYQSRAEEPPHPGLVLSMKQSGFLANQAISVFKDGPNLCVLDGRKRTIAACEANRQLKAEKREPLRVSVILKKGTEAELYAVMCAANENRTDVSDVERARELSKLMTYGKTVEEAGAVIGVDKGKASRLLTWLDCAAVVQQAGDAGKLPTSAAAKLAKLERAEQVVELKKLLAESGGERVRVTSAAKAVRKAKGESTVERPSRKVLCAVLKRAEDDEDTGGLLDVLRWVVTGEARGAFGKWLIKKSGSNEPELPYIPPNLPAAGKNPEAPAAPLLPPLPT